MYVVFDLVHLTIDNCYSMYYMSVETTAPDCWFYIPMHCILASNPVSVITVCWAGPKINHSLLLDNIMHKLSLKSNCQFYFWQANKFTFQKFWKIANHTCKRNQMKTFRFEINDLGSNEMLTTDQAGTTCEASSQQIRPRIISS